jgi:peptidoglycan/xylan/chitin deacetylase (PgdA/CDA1 family)
VPSFRQQLETIERWCRFPALERLDGARMAPRIADLVIRDVTPGAIVLLHDSARYAYRETAAATAEALPAVLEAIAAAGLELVGLRVRDS